MTENNKQFRSAAVSEIVGALILTALIVLAITVIGVSLLSEGPTPEVPALRIDVLENRYPLTLIHRGGDRLDYETTRIIIDGDDLTEFFKKREGILLKSWTEFESGDLLELDLPGASFDPKTVTIQIIHSAPEIPTLLFTLQYTPVEPVSILKANFQGVPRSGLIPLTVQFIDLSTGNVAAWQWDFGDGGFSNEQHPQWTYTNGGTYTVTLTVWDADTNSDIKVEVDYIIAVDPLAPPIADFTADITTGLPPLAVQFTDLSTGVIDSWEWVFGDGSPVSYAQNPIHTYTVSGLYPVSLTVTNTGGSDTEIIYDYIHVLTPAEYIAEESVFVYGTKLFFAGDYVIGVNSTIIITGDLDTADTNLGSGLFVSKIYINGSTTMNDGSASLGNPDFPNKIVINGDLELWSGSRNIYGDVYVDGNFALKDAIIHNNVYVNGDLTLGWTPTLYPETTIYYTGTITHPNNYDANILAKCVHQATVPTDSIPNLEMPALKDPIWYDDNGYVPSGSLTDNLRIYAPSYVGTFSWWPNPPPYEDVIIIAHSGDITIPEMGSEKITGVLFAPFGKVTVEGAQFEGVVLARDGFYMTKGGSHVVFTNLDDFFDDEEDWPFV
jgi:PKD repeat protein